MNNEIHETCCVSCGEIYCVPSKLGEAVLECRACRQPTVRHVAPGLPRDLPEYLYVFCSNSFFLTNYNLSNFGQIESAGHSWARGPHGKNFRRKYIRGSAQYLPFVPPDKPDCPTASFFSLSVIRNYAIEYNLEVYRYKHHPLSPSRLSCIYAFGDMETCQRVAEKHKWRLNQVKRFTLCPDVLTRIARGNMEVVSCLRNANAWTSVDDLNVAGAHYWNGDGDFDYEFPEFGPNGNVVGRKQMHIETIWEYLVEGCLTLA